MRHPRLLAPRFAALAGALLATLGGVSGARAQATDARLVVTYVEGAPALAPSVARTLDDYARRARGAPGAAYAEVLIETGRPERLAVVELWRKADGAAAEQAARGLQQRLGSGLVAPVDNRVGLPLSPPDETPPPAGAFHVLMHIDVVPDGAPTVAKSLQAQKASVLAAPGALRFEVAAQADRGNHFAVYEAWKSRAAYEAYVTTAPARALRDQLTAFKGALFDDRFYQAD